MNVSQAFDQFLNRDNISEQTRQKYYYRLYKFCRVMGNLDVGQITTADLSGYIQSRNQLNDVSRSILRQSFHAFFGYCRKRGWLEINPASALPRWRDTPRRVYVPPEKNVIAALETAVAMCRSDNPFDIRDGLIFSLAVYSGCRRDELRNLRLDELRDALQYPELDDGLVTHVAYTYGKTGEAIMRFSMFHASVFEKYLKVRPNSRSKAVFVNLNENHRQYGEKLSLTAFNRVRGKVCRRANVPVITYQELRRRIATMIARSQGVDIAAHALNHSPHSGDRVIRLFYYNPDRSAVNAAVSGIWLSHTGGVK